MDDNLFIPEWRVVAYSVFAVAFCIFIYSHHTLLKFAWGAAGMSEPVGGGRVLQTQEVDTMAGRAAAGAANALSSLSPGGAASLLVVAFWLFGAVLGMFLLPAAFGAMSRVSTINVVLVFIAGAAVAFSLSRLTATIMSLGVMLALAAIVCAVGIAVGVFVSGGQDGPLGRLLGDIRTKVSSIQDGMELEKSGSGRQLLKRIEFNICVMKSAVNTVGDMKLTRAKCDESWAAKQQQRFVDAKSLEDQTAMAWEKNENWMRKTSLGIKTLGIPANSESLATTWRGSLICPHSAYYVYLRLQGEPAQASGVAQVFPDARRTKGDIETYAAYRVTAVKSGSTVHIRRGADIAEGLGMPPIPTRFAHSPAFIPALSAEDVQQGCELQLRAKLLSNSKP